MVLQSLRGTSSGASLLRVGCCCRCLRRSHIDATQVNRATNFWSPPCATLNGKCCALFGSALRHSPRAVSVRVSRACVIVVVVGTWPRSPRPSVRCAHMRRRNCGRCRRCRRRRSSPPSALRLRSPPLSVRSTRLNSATKSRTNTGEGWREWAWQCDAVAAEMRAHSRRVPVALFSLVAVARSAGAQHGGKRFQPSGVAECKEITARTLEQARRGACGPARSSAVRIRQQRHAARAPSLSAVWLHRVLCISPHSASIESTRSFVRSTRC